MSAELNNLLKWLQGGGVVPIGTNQFKSPLLIFLILALVSFTYLMIQHEQAHGQILMYFGCDEVHYSLTSARCMGRSAQSEMPEFEILAQSINETAGHHMAALFVLITAATIYILAQIAETKKR